MNPIDEEEEDDGEMARRAVDQFSSVRPPPKCRNHHSSNNNICSGKQTSDETEHTKYQTTNRSNSLPSRQSISSNIKIEENVKQRRRYASDSNKNNKNTTTSLVTSFIQYLRSELRATTNDQKYDHSKTQKKKSTENINYLSQTINLSNNFYRQKYPIRMSSSNSSSSSSSQSIESSSNENLFKNHDDNEILKLINLLILRVECLNNENTLNNNKKNIYPTIKQIDQNLIEYLYFLFNKFINDESDLDKPMIDKSSFVNVCQTLVRNGCFNIPSTISPDQSFSETTITNSSDIISTHTSVHEHKPNTDDMPVEKSSVNEQISPALTNEQEAWLIIDLEPSTPEYPATPMDESSCLLQSSTSDEQFLLTNENYLSFEELKSCESESSHSNYYSPNSSLVDFQSMVQEFDELNNTNNNNNNITLFNEDGSSSSSSIEHASNNTNVIIEAKNTTTTTSNNNICTGLTNDCEHIASSSSSMESTESMTMKQNEKINRRERKMQERWTITTKNDNNNSDQLPTKTFLGVEFPPIAVLRRKFSSLPPPSPPILNPLPIKKKDSSSIKTKTLLNNTSQDNISPTLLKSSMSLPNQEINTSVEDKTKHDQILDLQSNDTLSLNDCKNNDIQQPIELLTDEDMTNETEEKSNLSLVESQNETIININNSELISDLCTLNYPSSSLLLSIPSSLTTNINENKPIEFLPKEIDEEEEEKKEEEHCDDNNVDVEKKNNSNIEQNDHASGTILINGEPTQAVLFEQEKKEKEEEQETKRPSSLLPTSEPCNQSQPEDESSSVPTLLNKLDELTMTNIDDNEQRYKTIEIEEISDEENDLSIKNNYTIEPTDCILTDDELHISRKSSSQSNIKTRNNIPLKVDPVLSCYEKALSNAVEKIDDSIKLKNRPSKEQQLPPITKHHQRPEDDPIALRALERFEQRMNAVAAKTSNDETSPSATKRKSSWSGTLTTPRKSLENLLKINQPLQSNSTSNSEESTTPPQRDTFIRPRKTILDDLGLNFGMTLNLFGTVQSNSTNDNDNHHKLEEQQQPTAFVQGDNKQIVLDESTTKIVDSEDRQQQEDQPMSINSSMTNENNFSNERDNSSSLVAPSLDSSLNTLILQSSSEQQSISPYRLQLEGRRRLNTLEHIRERHPNHESNDLAQQQQQQQQQEQFKNQYTLKPEYLQDPIIRRALERFDEKSRSLTQVKSHYYDDIQDPITRRALMRLDTNLKRTIPSNLPPTHNDLNERWYTNSYTLGSLQSNNEHRYPDSSLPPTSNYKPSHVSIHQRFNSTSSDMPELSANNIHSNNESDIPIMRVPTQPIYFTSNNQQQQPINLRQRSRSEHMLSSRDLSIGHTTNLDENDTSQLQINHSSNELQEQQQQQETPSTNEVVSNETDFQLPNTIVKSLDPNFVRTTEASVNYTTPTQSYSAYSCEYTRPRQNQLLTSSKSELSSPRNLQQENEIQYINSSSSAFTPVHPSTNNNSYSQQPLSIPSYNSMYTSNNPNQTPYSDDPIVRRALERFNCQMQNSLLNMSQHQPNMNHMSRQFSHGYLPQQSNFDSFHPTDPHQYDTWINSQRSIPPTSNNTNAGYQSIIGRRRQIRHDDIYHDNTNIGNGYSSSLFMNSQNSYPYMNYSDEPPIIPPRLHRDIYHEQPEYISDNVNNNNNNNNNSGYIHHGYPSAINGFHPFIPTDYYQQFQDDEYLRHRAQSTSSNTSSDSVNLIRLIQQRLPSTIVRTNLQQNKNILPDYSQLPSDETTPNNDNTTSDSVFHRLAYTATKSSLSKSSSNLYANLLNKTPQQQQNKSNNIKSNEIDDEESTVNTENNQESISTSTNITNKCQRSRSVDGRARIKNAQIRANNSTRPTNDDDDNHHSTTVPSSKFTSINARRDVHPPRIPIIPRSTTISDRTSIIKRVPNGNNLPSTRNGNSIRTRGSNGNLIETENDENLSFNDNYQPKIIDHKTRIGIPVHRYTTNIQTSASTSSVNSTNYRTKVPIPTSTNPLSPNGQRRNIPVSVFAPAKLENKRSAPVVPSSTSPINDSNTTYNCELQEQQQTSSSSLSSTGDSSYTTINNENEINNKLSSTNPTLKSSTGDILNEISLANDKHDTSKKMNVFERLFRGHKKKI